MSRVWLRSPDDPTPPNPADQPPRTPIELASARTSPTCGLSIQPHTREDPDDHHHPPAATGRAATRAAVHLHLELPHGLAPTNPQLDPPVPASQPPAEAIPMTTWILAGLVWLAAALGIAHLFGRAVRELDRADQATHPLHDA